MKSLLLWMILAQAGDITTTAIGLHRGCVERTYFGMQNPYAIGGVKAGATFTLTWGGVAHSSSKLVKTGVIVGAVSGTVGTVLNLRTLPRCR